MKLNLLFKAQGSLAAAQYADRWQAVRKTGSAKRRAFNSVAGLGPRGEAFPFDGLEETWLSSDVSPQDAGRAVHGLFPHLKAVDGILDWSASRIFLAEPVVIKEGRGAIKLVILSRRKPDIGAAEYLAYWSGTHGSIVRAQPGFNRLLKGYVQDHIVPGSFASPNGALPVGDVPFDGMMQMWFDSIEDMKAAFSSEDYRTIIRSDEPNFINVGHSIAFIADERSSSSSTS